MEESEEKEYDSKNYVIYQALPTCDTRFRVETHLFLVSYCHWE